MRIIPKIDRDLTKDLTPTDKQVVVGSSVKDGILGLMPGVGVGMTAKALIAALLRGKEEKKFKKEWPNVPEDTEGMVKFLRAQAQKERTIAEKTKWLSLIPIVTGITSGLHRGMSSYNGNAMAWRSEKTMLARMKPKERAEYIEKNF